MVCIEIDIDRYLDDNPPMCPNCNTMCRDFFIVNGNVIGCEECVDSVDAYDYIANELENSNFLHAEEEGDRYD